MCSSSGLLWFPYIIVYLCKEIKITEGEKNDMLNGGRERVNEEEILSESEKFEKRKNVMDEKSKRP